MPKFKLNHRSVTNPDFSRDGEKVPAYYVNPDPEGGADQFDEVAYAEAYGLKLEDIDAKSIRAVEKAVLELDPTHWLEVTHSEIE